MRRKVYIAGALTNVPPANERALKAFYQAIADLTADLGLEPYVPHNTTDPRENPDVEPPEVVTIDTGKVLESDLIIAYVGLPSLGTGMELGIAWERNIPVITLYEEGCELSRMVRGHPSVIEHITFEDLDDALDNLRAALRRHGFASASTQSKSTEGTAATT